jgi:hypothetical protein
MNGGELLPAELEAGIDQLLEGAPLPAVLERRPAQVWPYLRVFAVMLHAQPQPRPGFRERLRARLLAEQSPPVEPETLPDPAAVSECLAGVVIDPALAAILRRYSELRFGEPGARLLGEAMDELQN